MIPGIFGLNKKVTSIVSGDFEGKAIDANKDVRLIKDYFLNTKRCFHDLRLLLYMRPHLNPPQGEDFQTLK
jgi:hypothetical protein